MDYQRPCRLAGSFFSDLLFLRLQPYHVRMKNPVDDAYEKALKLLVLREHTRSELERKLKDKGYAGLSVQEALDRLEKEGSLDDRRFAEVFIRSRLKKNPEGRFLLAMRLEQKGCGKEAYQEILDEVFKSEEYIPCLKSAVDKSLRIRGKEKTLSAFIQKGFKASIIESLIDGDDINQD